MKWTTSIVAASVIAAWTGVAAQSGNPSQSGKMERMATMDRMDTTYTGCIEAAGPGRFTLAHAVAASDGMAASSMKDASMEKDAAAMATTKNDSTMSLTLALSSTAVDLSKHIGHRVAVTGTPARTMMDAAGRGAMAKEPAAFTVKSLKVASGSCS